MIIPNPLPQSDDMFDPATYREFLDTAWPVYGKQGNWESDLQLVQRYRARLPVHLLALCPICGTPFGEPVDTLSLNGFGWDLPNAGLGWAQRLGVQRKEYGYCKHLLCASFFLSLNGVVPDDLFEDKSIQAGPEVPSIMRAPMRPEGARAVIHHLPIARYDDPSSTAAYSVFFMTYFVPDEKEFSRQTKDWQPHYGMVDYDDADYELLPWVEQGRLLWLTAKDSAPALDTDDSESFPYGMIEGDRSSNRVITRSGVSDPGRKSILRRIGRMLGRSNR